MYIYEEKWMRFHSLISLARIIIYFFENGWSQTGKISESSIIFWFFNSIEWVQDFYPSALGPSFQ